MDRAVVHDGWARWGVVLLRSAACAHKQGTKEKVLRYWPSSGVDGLVGLGALPCRETLKIEATRDRALRGIPFAKVF